MRRALRVLAAPVALAVAALMAMPPPAAAMYLTGGSNTTTKAVQPVVPSGGGGTSSASSAASSSGGFDSVGSGGRGNGSSANGGAGTVITTQTSSLTATPTSNGTLVSISSSSKTYVLNNAGSCPVGDTCVRQWQNNITGGSATRYGFTAVGSGVVGLGTVGQSIVGSQTETTQVYNSSGQLVGVNQQTYNATTPNGFASNNFINGNFAALANLGSTPSPGGGSGSGTPSGGGSGGTPSGGGATGIGATPPPFPPPPNVGPTPPPSGGGPSSGGTPTPSSGGGSGAGTPPALTFAIYPTVVLTDQPQVNSAAYGETLLAGVWAPAGYTITNVSMSFADPRADVNGQAPATICMGQPPGATCQATLPAAAWSYHGDVAAAKFVEDWNSYYGFWDPSIGAGSNVNRTPDTFPVYATVTTVAPDGTTNTQTVEIPQFELMSSLTYPRVGPLEPIQDLSPLLAQAGTGNGSNSLGQAGGGADSGANVQTAQYHSAGNGGVLAAIGNSLAAAWNWMMQTLGFSSAPTSDLPPGAAVSGTQANG